MDGLELVCFEIIASVGGARSCYVEAIQLAKQQKFEEARKQIKEGEALFLSGHKAHASLVQKEANNESVEVSLLLVHAEDQLMSAETFKIMAEEFIDLYQVIYQK